jgi:hypothetical protein
VDETDDLTDVLDLDADTDDSLEVDEEPPIIAITRRTTITVKHPHPFRFLFGLSSFPFDELLSVTAEIAVPHSGQNFAFPTSEPQFGHFILNKPQHFYWLVLYVTSRP